MRYTIVQASDVAKLAQFVDQKMNEGWVPAGGIAVSYRPYEPHVRQGEWTAPGPMTPFYLQSMVRKERVVKV